MTPAIHLGVNGTSLMEGDWLLYNYAGRAVRSSTVSESTVRQAAGAEFRNPQSGSNRLRPESQQGPITNADGDLDLATNSAGASGNAPVIWTVGRPHSSFLTVRTTMNNNTLCLQQTNIQSQRTGPTCYKISPTLKNSFRPTRLNLKPNFSTQH